MSESAKNTGKYKLLRITDIQDNNVEWDKVPLTDYKVNKVEDYLLKSGDILFARTGATVGKSYLVDHLPYSSIYASYLIRIRVSSTILSQYLKKFFESGFYWSQIVDNSLGIGQPNVNGTSLANLIIPLPPLNEQKRIIEELVKWEGAYNKLEMNKREVVDLISQTKSKILSLAIQGKLVEQDPADEPAIDLLRRINPDFRPCDISHYLLKIPYGWCVARLEDLCSFISRGKSPKYSEKHIFPVFAQKCNLYSGGISLEHSRFLDPATLDKWPDIYKLKTGDILVNSTGTGTVGRTRLFHESVLGKFPFVVPDSHISVIRSFDEIKSEYLYTVLASAHYQEYIENNLAGSTNQKELYIGVLKDMEIPLPPLNEQKRIVAKIEELFTMLDVVKEQLTS